MDQQNINPVNLEQAQPRESDREARMWAMIGHIAGLGWFIVPLIGGVIGSLIIWQIKKDDFAFVDEHGKEAFNFQVSMLIYFCVAVVLCLVIIGAFLVPLVAVADVVFVLIAAIKANDGRHYRYPLTIRFFK